MSAATDRATTRAELAEALGHMNRHAMQLTHEVGTPGRPTLWDVAHQRVNETLTLWELAS